MDDTGDQKTKQETPGSSTVKRPVHEPKPLYDTPSDGDRALEQFYRERGALRSAD